MKLLIFLLSLCVTSLEAATITNWGAQLPTAVPASSDVILMQKGGVTYYFTPNQLATQLSTNVNLAVGGSDSNALYSIITANSNGLYVTETTRNAAVSNSVVALIGAGSTTPAQPISSVQFNSNGVMQGSAALLVTNGTLLMIATNNPNGYCPQCNVAAWGDSITAGSYFSITTNWPSMLALITGRQVYNGGVSGESSSQIAARATNATYSTMRPWTTVIWAGRNNITDITTVTNDIAKILSFNNPSRYFVFGILTGGSETNTTTSHGQVTNINAALSTVYGARYFDMRAYLMANGSGTNDDAYVARGTTPPSLMVQGEGGNNDIHPNESGMLLIAQKVAALIGNTNFMDRPLIPADLPNIFSNSWPFSRGLVAGLSSNVVVAPLGPELILINEQPKSDFLSSANALVMQHTTLHTYRDGAYDSTRLDLNVYPNASNQGLLRNTGLAGMRLQLNGNPNLGNNFSLRYFTAGSGVRPETKPFNVESDGTTTLGSESNFVATSAGKLWLGEPVRTVLDTPSLVIKNVTLLAYSDGSGLYDDTSWGLNVYANSANNPVLRTTTLPGMQMYMAGSPEKGTNFSIKYYTAGSGTRTAVELITVKETGNVGIGTTAPLDKLHVVGGIVQTNGGIWQSWSLAAPSAPASTNAGAVLWNDGTNFCAVFRNHAGVLSTNKLSMAAWP